MKFGNKQIPVMAETGCTYYIEIALDGFGWSAELLDADQGALDICENKITLNDADRAFGTDAPRVRPRPHGRM